MYGHSLFGSMLCFRNVKAAYLALSTKKRCSRSSEAKTVAYRRPIFARILYCVSRERAIVDDRRIDWKKLEIALVESARLTLENLLAQGIEPLYGAAFHSIFFGPTTRGTIYA
jgi:hypothetical protein